MKVSTKFEMYTNDPLATYSVPAVDTLRDVVTLLTF